jgi:uncharacterized RDD family membrane protein YckC
MQTIRITTSHNIDIDYEVAGLGERIVALLIDYAIFFLIYIAALILGIAGDLFRAGVTTIVVIIIYAVLFVFYDLICEIFMNGQSIGKRVMKIKVISLDGGRASVGQYFLRWIFRIVDFTMTVGGCALITAGVTKNCQRLGDLVAGTTLIKTQPRTKIDALAFQPVADGYEPVFREATQLKDKDVVLIHEVIESYMKNGNTTIIYNTTKQLRKVLDISAHAEMNDLLFLQTLIKDYNHIIATADAL